MNQITGLIWFVAVLVPLVFLQRSLHCEIQAVFLILSRDAWLTIVFFQIIFLPGVFLHELSHFLTAKLLRVRTGGFSVIRAHCQTDACSSVMWKPPNRTLCAIY